MVIENSKKFYENLLRGETVLFNFLTIRAFRFSEMDLVSEYIICDGEHYQYLQDELKHRMGMAQGSSMSKILTISLVGDPVRIIVKHDCKGINLFAKHKD